MNFLKTAFLLSLLTAALVGLGFLMGDAIGAAAAFVLALTFNANTYWRGAEIAIGAFDARPLEPGFDRLEKIVADLSARAGIPPPPIFVVESRHRNAFAAGRGPGHAILVFTRGALSELTWNEITAVAAHEIAHIKARDTMTMTVAATIAGAIAAFGAMLAVIGLLNHKEGGFGFIVFGAIAGLGAILLHLAIGRGREYAADRRGAELCGHPDWLAQALRRIAAGIQAWEPCHANQMALATLWIVQPFRGGIARLFDTHPPLEKRIARLEAMAIRHP